MYAIFISSSIQFPKAYKAEVYGSCLLVIREETPKMRLRGLTIIKQRSLLFIEWLQQLLVTFLGWYINVVE